MFATKALLLCVISCFAAASKADSDEPFYETEKRLRDIILTGYDKDVPPQQHINDSLEVNLQLALVAIESLDLAGEILTTHAWLRTTWSDKRLAWDPDQYNGLGVLSVPANKLWRPDIVPYNLAGDSFSFSTNYLAVIVPDFNESSLVTFIPHVRLQTRCPVSLWSFPFDTQVCFIKLGTWTYSGKVVTLKSDKFHAVDINNFSPNSMWDLVNATARISATRYACCDEDYYDWAATLTLRRRSHLVVHLYVGPAVCIGLMIPVLFLLPAGSSYKLILGGSLLVSQVLMLNVLSSALPISHVTAPAIVLYLLANVVLVCLSLATATVVIYCWNRAKRTGNGVPPVVDKIFLGVLGRLLQVKRDDYIEGDVDLPDGSTMRDPNDIQTTEDTMSMVNKQYTRLVAPAEWRQLSVVLDRLLFVLFTIITVATMASLVKYSN